jgi:DNA helicase-2/ATP-dependent DNA helicase PcrA
MSRTFAVMGPPGCGKTEYVTDQIQVAADKYGAHRVLAASYTRAAATELAERRGQILERTQVGTLHSFCYRALGVPPIVETPAGVKAWNEEMKGYPMFQMADGASAADVDEPVWDQGQGKAGDELFNRMNLLRARMVDLDTPLPQRAWPEDVLAFATRWEAFKRSNGMIDFTDMIELAWRDLPRAPGAPAVFFVDEAQDMNPLQWALVRRWAQDPTMDVLTVVGDGDQAIYGWAGSDPESMRGPFDASKPLSQSYRVPAKVYTLAMEVVHRIVNRDEVEYHPRSFEGSVQHLGPSQGNWTQPDRLLDLIEQELERKNDKGEPRSVMVLASCSYMLDPIKRAMRAAGIPFENQYRRKRGDWNPLHTSRGTGASERIACFLRLSEDVWGRQAAMWSPDDLRLWLDLLAIDGVLQKTRGVRTKIKNLSGHMPVDFNDLLELFEMDALDRATEQDLVWFQEHLLGSKAQTAQYPLTIAQKRGGRALLEKPRVTLGTVHSVKGGQADTVFLFPDLSAAGNAELHGPQLAREGVYRLFYVGVTRAREDLIIASKASPFAIAL